MAPGLNAGDTKAMAQATHGSAPDIAGRGIANPYAMIMSCKMLLAWLGAKHGEERLIFRRPAHRSRRRARDSGREASHR